MDFFFFGSDKMCHALNCLTHLNVKKLKFSSLVSYSSYDIKAKCVYYKNVRIGTAISILLEETVCCC